MAELRPYEQTWRDKIAAMLMGDTPGLARRNMVSGLMGSTGTGSTGMGLVDATPAGIPFAVQESRNEAMAGNPFGATMNAMAVIPGAKIATEPAKAGAQKLAKALMGETHGLPNPPPIGAQRAIDNPMGLNQKYQAMGESQPDKFAMVGSAADRARALMESYGYKFRRDQQSGLSEARYLSFTNENPFRISKKGIAELSSEMKAAGIKLQNNPTDRDFTVRISGHTSPGSDYGTPNYQWRVDNPRDDESRLKMILDAMVKKARERPSGDAF